jgi:hypothetical protein
MINQFIDKVVSENENNSVIRSQMVNQYIIPTTDMEVDVYTEGHRTNSGRAQDERLPVIKDWLAEPLKRPLGYDDKMMRSLIRSASHFFVTKEGKMYKRGLRGDNGRSGEGM